MTNLQELRALIIKETKERNYVGPVTLLMALAVQYRNIALCIDPYNHNIRHIYFNEENNKTYLCEWNLTKDFDNQAPETINSLLKLIKGES